MRAPQVTQNVVVDIAQTMLIYLLMGLEKLLLDVSTSGFFRREEVKQTNHHYIMILSGSHLINHHAKFLHLELVVMDGQIPS